MQNIIPSEIVEVAIKLEEAGEAFYKDLADIASETRSLFESLAVAEAKHAELFRTLDPDGALSTNDEVSRYLTHLMQTGPIRNLNESGQLGESPLNLDEAFSTAIQLEKDTILFYTGFNALLTPQAAEINTRILAEEKKHLQRIVATRKRLQTQR
jgi:rubrerythrin